MASQLDTIYDAIGAWAFTVQSQAIGCFWDSTLKQQITTADLPARLLLPVNTNMEGDQIQVMTFGGGVAEAMWVITDLMLYKPTTQGAGLEEAAPFLVDYVKAYVNNLKTGKKLLTRATVIQAAATTGVIEWPMESRKYYHSATVTLQIKEVF